MNSKIVETFWRLWLSGLADIRKQNQIGPSEIMTKYEVPLGARMVREVEKMCDRVKDWGEFGDISFRSPPRGRWHAEGDKVFIRIQHRVYGPGPEGAKYYGTSIQEFPLDLVEKVVALGCVPPLSEKPVPGGQGG